MTNSSNAETKAGTALPASESGPRHAQPEPLTIFVCGPSKCEHDYSGDGLVLKDGWTAVCAKCGALAIDEAVWL